VCLYGPFTMPQQEGLKVRARSALVAQGIEQWFPKSIWRPIRLSVKAAKPQVSTLEVLRR